MILPLSGKSNPAINLNKTLFPIPLGPIIPIIDPSDTSNDRFLKTA